MTRSRLSDSAQVLMVSEYSELQATAQRIALWQTAKIGPLPRDFLPVRLLCDRICSTGCHMARSSTLGDPIPGVSPGLLLSGDQGGRIPFPPVFPERIRRKRASPCGTEQLFNEESKVGIGIDSGFVISPFPDAEGTEPKLAISSGLFSNLTSSKSGSMPSDCDSIVPSPSTSSVRPRNCCIAWVTSWLVPLLLI